MVVATVVGTVAVQVVVLAALTRLTDIDLAVGGVVLRAQREVEIPFPTALTAPGRIPHADPPGAEVGGVRNLVLILGDGMGVGQASTASMVLHGPDGGLAAEAADAVGLHSTTVGNSLIADSAASASALASGLRVDRKALSWLPDGRRPRTLMEAARQRGMAVGVVTTSGLVDATPAAFLAHVPHRERYAEILGQMLASGVEVMVGGDWTAYPKARLDRRYLALLNRAKELVPPGTTLVRDAVSLRAATGPVVALLPPRPGRPASYGPRLEETTLEALERLVTDPDGFVLLVENEATDNAGHDNDVAAVVSAVEELDETVRAVLEVTADRGDTLVLLTADHDTGGLAVVSGPYARGTARVRWASHDHTAQWVPLFAWGPGAEVFDGVLHATEIARRLGALLELPDFPDPDPPR